MVTVGHAAERSMKGKRIPHTLSRKRKPVSQRLRAYETAPAWGPGGHGGRASGSQRSEPPETGLYHVSHSLFLILFFTKHIISLF